MIFRYIIIHFISASHHIPCVLYYYMSHVFSRETLSNILMIHIILILHRRPKFPMVESSCWLHAYLLYMYINIIFDAKLFRDGAIRTTRYNFYTIVKWGKTVRYTLCNKPKPTAMKYNNIRVACIWMYRTRSIGWEGRIWRHLTRSEKKNNKNLVPAMTATASTEAEATTATRLIRVWNASASPATGVHNKCAAPSGSVSRPAFAELDLVVRCVCTALIGSSPPSKKKKI